MLPAYEGRLAFGDLAERDNRAGLARWITCRKETRFHELGLDAGRVAERINDGPPALGSALGIALRACTEEHGKVRWGDKRPAYALHVAEILRLFPDAQSVHLVRDGRDRVASLLRMPWWHRGFHEAVAAWAQVVDTTRKCARELGPGSWYRLRFEDLVAGPEGQLRGVCGFLGEEYAPGATEPHRVAGMAVPVAQHLAPVHPRRAGHRPGGHLDHRTDARSNTTARGRIGRTADLVRPRTRRCRPPRPRRTAALPAGGGAAPGHPRRAADAGPPGAGA